MSYINRGNPVDTWCDIHFTNFTPTGQALIINTPSVIDLTGFSTNYAYMSGFTDLGGGSIRYDGSGEYHLIVFNYLFFIHLTGTAASIGLSININGSEEVNSRGLFVIGTNTTGHTINHEYILYLNTNDIITYNVTDYSRSETITFQKFSTTIKSLIQL